MAKKPSNPNSQSNAKPARGRRPLSAEVLATRVEWKEQFNVILEEHSDRLELVELAAEVTARLKRRNADADAVSPSLVWQWARLDDDEFGKSASGTRTPATRRQCEVLVDVLSAWVLCTSALLGHRGVVGSAAFSPDGTRIVTASYDCTARLWDAASGGLLHTLQGHEEYVNSAAFSPDGTRIVTASFDRTARVWDAASGGPLHTLQGHEGTVNSAAFSPDGTRIITASNDRTARVWDAASGGLLHTLQGHESTVNSAAFSPDGTRIVTASEDRTARVWDVSTRASIAELKGHTELVLFAAFSPDGTRIVTASADGTARVWDVEAAIGPTGRAIRRLQEISGELFPGGLGDDEADEVDDDSAAGGRIRSRITPEEVRELRVDEAKPVPAAAPPQAAPVGWLRGQRVALPDVRRGVTHRFSVGGRDGYVTAGLYEDGSPGEVVITLAGADAVVAGLIDGVAAAASVALQCGVSPAALVHTFAGLRFEPAGATGNPEIPFVKSILEYVFRWLALEFVPGYRAANVSAGG